MVVLEVDKVADMEVAAKPHIQTFSLSNSRFLLIPFDSDLNLGLIDITIYIFRIFLLKSFNLPPIPNVF